MVVSGDVMLISDRCIKILDRCRGRIYDLAHNVDTGRKMDLEGLTVRGANRQFARPYRVTLPGSMRAVLSRIPIDPDLTFIDIGCGKGCTLLTASEFKFRRIIGVEFAEELACIAQKNILRYRGKQACTAIEIDQRDATEFVFPPGPLMIYFFNPFEAPVMEKVLGNLRESLEKFPRAVTIVCASTYHSETISRVFQPRRTERILWFCVYTNDEGLLEEKSNSVSST
jgi:tRNA A58 N-methylase Trm61